MRNGISSIQRLSVQLFLPCEGYSFDSSVEAAKLEIRKRDLGRAQDDG